MKVLRDKREFKYRRLRTGLMFVIAFVEFIIFSASALAFKGNVHVWIAQQVIENLAKCEAAEKKPCIFVEVSTSDVPGSFGGSSPSMVAIELESDVAEAIKKYPDYYRMGSIGPDAYPGIYEGQMVIHPGINETERGVRRRVGYGTGEFLGYLLRQARLQSNLDERQKSLAFAYGFFSHAAADVFAHTYVNTYSGDIFELTDGEAAVETRHLALESFIEGHTPPLAIGPAHQLVQTQRQLSVPAKFVRDSLIFGNDVQNEYAKAQGVEYLILIKNLRQTLVNLMCQKDSNLSNEQFAKSILGKVTDNYGGTGNGNGDVDPTTFEEARKNLFSDDPVTSYKKRLTDKLNSYKAYANIDTECPVQQIDVLVWQIIAAYWLDLELTNAEAKKVSEIQQGIERFVDKTGGELLKLLHEIENRTAELSRIGFTAAKAQTDAAFEAMKKLGALVAPLGGLNDKKAEAERKLADAQAELTKLGDFVCPAIKNACSDNEFRRTVSKVEKVPCQVPGKVWGTCSRTVERECGRFSEISYPCPTVKNPRKKCTKRTFVSKICKEVEKYRCKVDGMVASTCDKTVQVVSVDTQAKNACIAARTACEQKKALYDTTRKGLDSAIALQHEAMKGLIESISGQNKMIDQAKKAAKDSIDLVYQSYRDALTLKQGLDGDITEAVRRLGKGLRGSIGGWIDDIDLAMAEYVKANGQAIVNTMDEDRDTTPQKPLFDWLACYHNVIAGVPTPLTNVTTCRLITAKEKVDAARKEFTEIKLSLAPAKVQELYRKVDEAIALLPYEIAKRTAGAFEDLIGRYDTNPALLMEAVRKTITEDELNGIFARDGSGKHLVCFAGENGGVSARVKFDMQLSSPDGKYDPRNFAPVSNAVVLSELSLLDAAGLNALLSSRGVERLYDSAKNNNVLTHSITSIDGNHQWMQLAPPYLRAETATNDSHWTESRDDTAVVWRRFSMQETQDGSYGFKLYTESAARHNVFERVFRGPLAPGLEQILPRVAPSDYPFKITPEEPFGIIE